MPCITNHRRESVLEYESRDSSACTVSRHIGGPWTCVFYIAKGYGVFDTIEAKAWLNMKAAIAQLGERQTEDLKVSGSIPDRGIFFAISMYHPAPNNNPVRPDN